MRYVLRKLGFYLIAAWVALTINFLLPRLLPGNPIEVLIGKMSQAAPVPPGEYQVLTKMLGLGTGNIFQKYWQYIDSLAHLRLGLSVSDFPVPVSSGRRRPVPAAGSVSAARTPWRSAPPGRRTSWSARPTARCAGCTTPPVRAQSLRDWRASEPLSR